MALAAVVAGSSCLAGFPSTDNPLSTVKAESEGVLPSDERGVIYADSRTDFRDESIYFLITDTCSWRKAEYRLQSWKVEYYAKC